MKPRLLATLCLLLVACAPALPRPSPPASATATRVAAPSRTAAPLTEVGDPAATLTFAPPATRPPTSTPFLGQVSLPNATLNYYRVSGATAADLRAALDANGLRDEAGDRGDALTRWYISWHWPGFGLPICTLRAVKVAYNIQVTLPRWNPPPEAAPALREQWAAYLAALALHERGHVQNIVSHYRDVETAILAANCRTADAAAQAVAARLRVFDATYDAATQHGATQGAVFP